MKNTPNKKLIMSKAKDFKINLIFLTDLRRKLFTSSYFPNIKTDD